MATYDAKTRPDFWKLQVTTTRNIIGGMEFHNGLLIGYVEDFNTR